MGWASGKNAAGRDVGYSVEAVCDLEGCDAQIDLGLAFVCGGMHDGDEHGCGDYFCGEHLSYYWRGEDEEEMSPQLCDKCGDLWMKGDEEASGEDGAVVDSPPPVGATPEDSVEQPSRGRPRG